MKKGRIIFGFAIITLSLSVFGCSGSNETTSEVNQNSCCKKETSPKVNLVNMTNMIPQPKFVYEIGSRFYATITKSDLQKATEIIDLVPKEGTEGIVSFKDVRIKVLSSTDDIFELGNSNTLNLHQRDLLNTLDYTDDFVIEATSKHEGLNGEKFNNRNFIYYVSVVPTYQAEYIGGKKLLLNYLRENSKEMVMDLDEDDIDAGKLRFTIGKNGTVKEVHLMSTSGFVKVDKKMVKLIQNLPKKWNPAKNSNGNLMEQELIFSFGMVGC